MSLIGLYLFPDSLKCIRIKSIGIFYSNNLDLIRSREANINANF
nr:MAG TPA: hypothetical protein [Caudoviricetes sp.]